MRIIEDGAIVYENSEKKMKSKNDMRHDIICNRDKFSSFNVFYEILYSYYDKLVLN